ncbi:NRAMP family divalent metal transporter [Paenactinomyces guangxiensis]|uniref:Divalent metal cation transporter n=1 Tax=Paenactinomyces guangxiensis TaxID=1490290 RepID=A0A7W2A9M2_9BACL|nr:NRAMP family divalent metal transporter [Paenactinomyces guangxiensis]MBA4495424.1 divalent metal cation transporter [Paenactinomyces guangxiensis]MBH8592455.1 divalent metal cation transporter [Paenactinomyces guangxiensis]
MATSAIGPGFLTQTTVFTERLMASFGFVILISILLDIGAQMNIWRIICVTEKRGQEIANLVLPGLGIFIALAVALGGLAFNIGNLGGAGLGFQAMFGLNTRIGAVITAVFAIIIFMFKEAGAAMDRVARWLGLLMILLTAYVAIVSSPPVGEAALRTVLPEKMDIMAIITLVGGTVGGYITFAGGHRLLDAGISGRESLGEVTKSSVTGILVASAMRVILFLAVLGIVVQGVKLSADNPMATVFETAAGSIGLKLFGLVLWSASLTSVVGAAYTSVTFLTSFSPAMERHRSKIVITFILVSTLILTLVGQPVQLLILAGALNGLILPLILGTMLIAAHRRKIVGDYRHPVWMTVFGTLVALGTAWFGVLTLIEKIPQLFA